MTTNIPKLDILHLKLAGQPGITSMPLCEVINGRYSKTEDGTHMIHTVIPGCNESSYAMLDSGKMGSFFDKAFMDIAEIDSWVIQEAGEEPSIHVRGFIEKYG